MLTVFRLAAALPMADASVPTAVEARPDATATTAVEQKMPQWQASRKQDDSAQQTFLSTDEAPRRITRSAATRMASWETTPESVFHEIAVKPVVAEPDYGSFGLRGQSPGYDEDPSLGGNLNQQQFLSPPMVGQAFPWPEGGAMTAGTPMLGMPDGYPATSSVYGANGPQPVRFGWAVNADVGLLGKAKTSTGADGQFGVFEVNTEARYTTSLPTQWIFSIAPQFNLRLWDGPTLDGGTTTMAAAPLTTTRVTTVGLPGEVYRLGGDLRLTSPTWGPYTVELGFTPSLNTDFEEAASSDAWIFDGRGALIVRTSPQWMWVLGATYWDRVQDRVLPYAGVVYTPNDRLEIRALFPRADINVFMGTPWGVPQWLYVAGEYHIEAYQLQLPRRTVTTTTDGMTTTRTEATTFTRDRIELEDWRVLGGIRSEYNGMTSFLEAGWVFGRQVQFARSTSPSGFDISSGFIARFGLRF
jgi:hypothetical protein